jgi:hypothetical protein
MSDESAGERLDYLAGYFDGEGCITVLSLARGRYPQLRITIVSADQEVLKLFTRLGGKDVYEVTKSHLRWALSSRLYRWSVSGIAAVPVLSTLEPHLIAKREQARVALSVDWATSTRGLQPDDDILQKRWWAKRELQRLKSLNLYNKERGGLSLAECSSPVASS